MNEITDRTPDEIRLWWDRGILWINVAEGTLAVNGLEAMALLKRLQDEQQQIEAQITIDEKMYHEPTKPYAMITDTQTANATYSVKPFVPLVPYEELATFKALKKLLEEGR